MRLPCLIFAALLAAGCVRVPDLGPNAEAAAAVRGPWPVLEPRAKVAAAAAQVTDNAALGEVAKSVDARAALLRKRAALLNQPVIDQAALARLNAAIAAQPQR